MLDLQTLLSPRSDAAPCGEDLEYDEDFIALEMASRPGEERAIGDAVIAAEDPDYDQVIDLAPAILGRSMDLRAAVMLADAVLHRGGLRDFSAVMAYVLGALRDHWDNVHPQLDEDDDDPTMRVNAVLGLTNRETVLQSLRRTPLVNSRGFGRFSLRDIEMATGEAATPDGEDAAPLQTISAAFQDADQDEMAKDLAEVSLCLEHIKEISAIFDSQIGMSGPDLTPLEKTVFDIHRRMSDLSGVDAGVDTGVDTGVPVPDASDAPQKATSAIPSGVPGTVQSPADVTRSLDAIMDYYARCEPSSPLPVLLERAKRLVSADFVTIMKDMAPLGVENVALIGGFPAESDTEEDY